MNHKTRLLGSVVAVAAIAVCATVAPRPARAIEWDQVAGKEVVLFYAGQASWEWALTKSDHSGAKKFRGGKNCRECHAGEEADIGELIASGEKLEPTPVDTRRGAIPTNVKVAHDGERLFVRLEWAASGTTPSDKMDADFAAKVTVMFDDGGVKSAARAGCWAVCHDDAGGMASDPDDGTAIKKYLSRSRTKLTRKGGGRNLKASGDFVTMLENGTFLEYWQARLNPGSPPVAAAGYILEDRHEIDPPAVTAEGANTDGKWVVVLSRALQPDGANLKAIVPGKTYNVGFAIHDAYSAGRFHNVSFEYTLVLDQGEADFIAVRR